jgi:Zn-dependent protease
MSLDVALILFQVVALVLAFSVHECAHAYAAWRLGDPTAKMLGRVTLNPLKHLDPLGSVLFPLIAMFYHLPLIGWAKPCPVTPRNFKHYRRDDILTTMAGPASNLALATGALVLLLSMKHVVAGGGAAIVAAMGLAFHFTGIDLTVLPPLFPLALLLYYVLLINLTLFVFNLIPIPPLDGSRVLRHYLPYGALKVYDNLGIFSLLILMTVGGRILGVFFYPLLNVFNGALGTL